MSSTSLCFRWNWNSGVIATFVNMVMFSTRFPFGWNWNNGVSATFVKLIGSFPSSSGAPFPRGNNVFGFLSFMGAIMHLGVFSSSKEVMSLVGVLFLVMSMFLRAFFFLGTPILQEIFRNMGGVILPWETCIKEDTLLLLVLVWGDHNKW